MTSPDVPSSEGLGDSAATVASRGRVVLVTGLSGAGMSVALKALEDLGYEAVDNLRLSLVPALIRQADPKRRPLALASRSSDGAAACANSGTSVAAAVAPPSARISRRLYAIGLSRSSADAYSRASGGFMIALT